MCLFLIFARKADIDIERGKMLACTEMITMCLQSAKHEHLRKQQELDHNQNQGFSLVQDVSTLWVFFLHHPDISNQHTFINIFWVNYRL